MERERVERMVEWARGNPQGPVSIHLDPTNRCNIKCVFCWMRSHERWGMLDTSNELSDERLLHLVDEAADLGVIDWLLSGGGEPTLRPVAIDVMKKIKMRGMAGDIITNGTLFRENDIRDLIELGWDRFRISMLGPTEEVHDRLADHKGAFKAANRTMRWIKAYKEKFGKEQPEIGFNMVLSSGNYQHLPEMVEMLVEMGGTNINTQTIILYSEDEEWVSLDGDMRKEFPKYARRAVSIARKHNVRTNLDSYLDEKLVEKSAQLAKIHELMETPFEGFVGGHCFEQFYLMTVRANGIVGSCRLFGDEGTDLHHNTLADVWWGTYFTRSRAQVMRHEIFDYCKHCNANEYMENVKIRKEMVPLAQKNGVPVIEKKEGERVAAVPAMPAQ